MTTEELKEEIKRRVNDLPDDYLPDVLNFIIALQQVQGNAEAVAQIHNQNIIARNRETLGKLAQENLKQFPQ